MKKTLRRLRRELALRLDIAKHRHLYPWSDGKARRKDPTYGRIDRDLQWFVNDFLQPSSTAHRVALENTIQQRRDARA